jgi:hypothetical protein
MSTVWGGGGGRVCININGNNGVYFKTYQGLR